MTIPQLYGMAYTSPLIVMSMLPAKHHAPVYLDPNWGDMDFKKNVEPALAAIDPGRTPVVLAGNLLALQRFVRHFPSVPNFKVILFDIPAIILPFMDPLIEWLDCDHQAGGAWQTKKIKPERLEDDLNYLSLVGSDGRDLIMRMTRFVPRERISEVEQISEMLQEGMPKEYTDLLQEIDGGGPVEPKDLDKEYTIKDQKWKSRTLLSLLSDFCSQIPKGKRKEVVDVVLQYQLGYLNKRDYNVRLNKVLKDTESGKKTKDNEAHKKMVVLLRKWLDENSLGFSLHLAYLDYLVNIEKRWWKTILDNATNVSEDDLLMLISYQPRSPEILDAYADDSKDALKLGADDPLPKRSFKWDHGELAYHPQPKDLAQLFDY